MEGAGKIYNILSSGSCTQEFTLLVDKALPSFHQTTAQHTYSKFYFDTLKIKCSQPIVNLGYRRNKHWCMFMCTCVQSKRIFISECPKIYLVVLKHQTHGYPFIFCCRLAFLLASLLHCLKTKKERDKVTGWLRKLYEAP